MLVVLVVLLIAVVVVAAILGAIGAAANRVKASDEFLLWVIGGAIGGVLAALGWIGIIVGVTLGIALNLAYSCVAASLFLWILTRARSTWIHRGNGQAEGNGVDVGAPRFVIMSLIG